MFLVTAFGLFLASVALASPLLESPLDKRVDTTTYDNLVFYLKYASSVYNTDCANPNGNTLVTTVRMFITPYAITRAHALLKA